MADKRFIQKISKIWLIIIVAIFAIVGNYYFAGALESKLERYEVGVSMLTRTLLVSLFIGNWFFIRYVNKRKNSAKLSISQSQYVDTTINFVVLANTFLLILLPAAFLSLNAMRIFRYMAIINFTFVTNKFSNRIIGIAWNTAVTIMYAAIYLCVTYLMHSSSYDLIIEGIFNDNLFF
jgi:hypothetical protein